MNGTSDSGITYKIWMVESGSSETALTVKHKVSPIAIVNLVGKHFPPFASHVVWHAMRDLYWLPSYSPPLQL